MAPAPTVANRPTVVPATTTAPAPIDEPARRRMGLTVQSSARASSPVGRDGAREAVVREDRVRPDEDAVLDGHAVIDERGVLDLHAVAEDDALVDEGIPADDAFGADARTDADLRAMPDAGPRTDDDVGFEVGRRVDARGRVDHSGGGLPAVG